MDQLKWEGFPFDAIGVLYGSERTLTFANVAAGTFDGRKSTGNANAQALIILLS